MIIYDDKTDITALDEQIPFMRGVLPPKLEKQYMNPIRYRMNYRIIPCYALLCAACLISGIVLMEIDEKKFTLVFVGLLAIIMLLSVWLLLSVPKMRKKELLLEMERYDFHDADIPQDSRYIIEYGGAELVFDSNGIDVDGTFYWYSHLNPQLVTSNRFNRVWAAIMFGNDPVKSLFVPISPVLIRAVKTLEIPLQNKEAFSYLVQHKENAFAQIYKYGTFQIFDYD